MSDAVIIAICTAIPPTVASLCGVWVSLANRAKLKALHRSFHERRDEEKG